MSKSTEQLLKESIAEGRESQIDVLKETVALLKGWVAELRQEKEARFGEWTTLAELRFGAIFETEDGKRGCKCFNPDWMLSSYTSLGNGKMVVAKDAKNLKVREIQIP